MRNNVYNFVDYFRKWSYQPLDSNLGVLDELIEFPRNDDGHYVVESKDATAIFEIRTTNDFSIYIAEIPIKPE